MTRSQSRFLAALAILGGALCVWAALTMMLARVAHADPVGATQDALSTDWSAISQYGLIPGIAMVVYAAVSWFLKRNESEHWIAQGRSLALVTAGCAIAGSFLSWKYLGAQPGAIMGAVMAMIALVLHPEAKAGPVPAPVPAQTTEVVSKTFPPSSTSGTAGMLAVLLLGSAIAGLTVTGSGCGASQRESTIKAALVTVDAAREAFLVYDSHKQTEIVNAAASLEDGKTKLAAYRSSRGKVEVAFETAYRAIATAATLNDDLSLAALTKAVADANAVVAALTGGSK